MQKLVSDFGHYRCYLESAGGLTDFFRYLGVKRTAEAEDYVDLIEEIAAQQKDRPLDRYQSSYVKNAYRRLAKEGDYWVVSLLEETRSVLGRDGHLYRPDHIFIEDKPRPLKYFNKSEIPLVMEDLDDELRTFLHDKLGVKNFSRTKKHLRNNYRCP